MKRLLLFVLLSIALPFSVGAVPLTGTMTTYWKSKSGTADAFDVLVFGQQVSTGPISYELVGSHTPITFDFDTMTVSYTELLAFDSPLLQSLSAPRQLAEFSVTGSFSVTPNDLTPDTQTDVTFEFGPQDGVGGFLDGQLLSGITYNNSKSVDPIVMPLVVSFLPLEVRFGVFVACQILDDVDCDDFFYNASFSAIVSSDNVEIDNPVVALVGPTDIFSTETGAITPQPVPIPISAVLLGSGLIFLAGWRKFLA